MASESEQLAQIMSSKYAESLMLWSQQMTDLLSEHVTEVTDQGAEGMSDDFVGVTTMRPLNTREVDLSAEPIDTWRRWMFFDDYYNDVLVAKHDEIRLKTMTQARSEFARSQVAAANRKAMQVTINSIKATVYTGKNGTVPVSFPASQTIGDGTTTFTTALFDAGVQKLKTRGLVDDNENDRVTCIWNAKMEQSFFGAVEVASRDYSSQMVRDKGRIVSFGLVDFVRVEDLFDMKTGNLLEQYLPWTSAATGTRSAFMFVKKKSLKRWKPYSANGIVTWEQQKRSYRVSTDLSIGGRRNHEYGAVEILVKEVKDWLP